MGGSKYQNAGMGGWVSTKMLVWGGGGGKYQNVGMGFGGGGGGGGVSPKTAHAIPSLAYEPWTHYPN